MLQIWTPLPIGATGIVASIYWRSAGIPILNSSADFLIPLCRVLPIRQDINYWFCFTGAETEIHKSKTTAKLREKRTSIAAVRDILWTFGTFPTPLLSRYRLPRESATRKKGDRKGAKRSQYVSDCGDRYYILCLFCCRLWFYVFPFPPQ